MIEAVWQHWRTYLQHDFSELATARSTLVLSDSGGLHEEAPSLGKPVLVLRRTTERPEAVAGGTVRLVGTSETDIVQVVTRLLTDELAYRKMATAVNPYGDGLAAKRITAAILRHFGFPAEDLEPSPRSPVRARP